MATASDHNNGDVAVDVVVIGAGISGLCAAYDILKERNDSKVVILEAKGNFSKSLYISKIYLGKILENVH
jgi:ribulose 1,5-bisphosphate synthetase/thiazole synthase